MTQQSLWASPAMARIIGGADRGRCDIPLPERRIAILGMAWTLVHGAKRGPDSEYGRGELRRAPRATIYRFGADRTTYPSNPIVGTFEIRARRTTLFQIGLSVNSDCASGRLSFIR